MTNVPRVPTPDSPSAPAAAIPEPAASPFVPLTVRSHYSFLNSTLATGDMVRLAHEHGCPAIGLCDEGNLHGAVEFTAAATLAKLDPVLGVEVRCQGHPMWLYVEDATGYATLCRWLSAARGSATAPRLTTPSATENLDQDADDPRPAASGARIPDLGQWLGRVQDPAETNGLIAVGTDPALARWFPGRYYRALRTRGDLRRYDPHDPLPAVPVLPVHYALPTDRWRFDLIQSIRTLTLLRQAHPDKLDGGNYHFRGPADVARLFRGHEELLAHTVAIAGRCRFRIPLGKPQFPAFAPPDGSSAHDFLRRLVLAGAVRRYGPGRLNAVRGQIEEELGIIAAVGYEEYFLIVWDLLRDCRAQGIEWITRGSAADSLVCYCLGISDVCPVRFDLYFRRFLNLERMALNKLPDIDIDFAHDRKDTVVDLLFRKYRPEHCAVVGGFSTFRARSAFAEVAKVMGVAEREVRRFTEHFPWSFGSGTDDPRLAAEPRSQKAEGRSPPSPASGTALSQASGASQEGRLVAMLRSRVETRDLPFEEEPYRSALAMAEFLEGVPRYAKMHPCGVVLSRQPMHELTPTFVSGKGWPTSDFDMDAVEAIGLVKMDILAQGGLAVMRDTVAALQERGIEVELNRCESHGAGSTKYETPSSRAARKFEVPGPGEAAPSLEASPRGAAGVRGSGVGASLELGLLELGLLETGVSPDWLLVPETAPLREFHDPRVWDLIATGNARAVHHIESPAMTSLCRMCNVQDIDTLVAIVSVIRPGAANEDKKREFARRYQGLRPVEYAHPSLEPVLRSTFGLVVYEEHILQICDVFAGMPGGTADLLRRALVKELWPRVAGLQEEFFACAARHGRSRAEAERVWELVTGFHGYAFCKAHSAAYGVEAYQAAWLKCNFPAEFLAGVLTHGKGFYRPLVYVLECWRLGIPILPPWVNEPGPAFRVVDRPAGLADPARLHTGPRVIRVPVGRIGSLTAATNERVLAERKHRAFGSLADFFHRVQPTRDELETLSRAGALDGFGASRCEQFWEIQTLCARAGAGAAAGQPWLLAPGSGPSLRERASGGTAVGLPTTLAEPSRLQRLTWEAGLLGFPASGHPLELHPEIAWDTYCPVARLADFAGQEVTLCGLVIEDRVHHQVTGEPMKFLTLCDWTGIVETELFAQSYRSYGLATVRYPVLEVTGRVEPFENGKGHTLRVLRAGKPRVVAGQAGGAIPA